MADGFTIDDSEIVALTAAIEREAAEVGVNVVKAVKFSSFEVKKKWADKLKGEPRLPHASRSIGFDVRVNPGKVTTVTGEIGAERGKLQAPIVTVVEFGAPGNNTAPRGYGAGALHETEPDFIHGIELATGL